MHVRVLGRVELCGGDVAEVAGVKPRAVLTYLGLHVGHAVPVAVLVDLLWGDEPPRTADRALQTHVSALRRAIGADAVLRRGDGWLLDVTSIDVAEFTSSIRHGKEAHRAGAVEEAAELYAHALDAWRGAPELPDTPRGRAEVTRWREIHDEVLEECFDVRLSAGEAPELVADLEAAVAETPLRERRWSLLMLALYRSGRQAEALRAYQRFREMLTAELGLEPSAELQRLERRIAMHDESLLVPPPSAGAASSGEVPPAEARRARRPRRSFWRRMTRAGGEPVAIMAAGAGGALGILTGLGVPAVVGLGGLGWVLAAALPALRHGEEAPSEVTTDLRQPWQRLVGQAVEAQGRFRTAIAGVAAGPIKDRLARIGEQVDQGVDKARRVARRGQELDDARRQIDTFGVERELVELDDESASDPSRARTADALRSQLATADRLDRVLTDTLGRLRLLAASLGEAVARSFELSARVGGPDELGDLGEDLDDVLEEMEALRQALEDTER